MCAVFYIKAGCFRSPNHAFSLSLMMAAQGLKSAENFNRAAYVEGC
jgi:hypothetical protein